MTDNIKLPLVATSDHPEFPVLAWSPLELAEINRLMREAVRLNAQAVPDGMVLVPVEPTPEMIDAANLARKYREHGALTDPDVLNSRTYNSRQAYAAMLSAAPAAQAAPQPAQQPLTDGQMWELWNRQGSDEMNQQEAINFARAIEQAHGIGVKND